VLDNAVKIIISSGYYQPVMISLRTFALIGFVSRLTTIMEMTIEDECEKDPLYSLNDQLIAYGNEGKFYHGGMGDSYQSALCRFHDRHDGRPIDYGDLG